MQGGGGAVVQAPSAQPDTGGQEKLAHDTRRHSPFGHAPPPTRLHATPPPTPCSDARYPYPPTTLYPAAEGKLIRKG